MVSDQRPKLPLPKRPMLSPALVDAFKRDRVAAAIAELTGEIGLNQLSISVITTRAVMARATFYDLFANREAAIAYAVELGNRRLARAIDDGADSDGPPGQRIEAVVANFLDAVASEPALSALALVHGQAIAGPDVPFSQDLVQALAGVMRAARRSEPKPGPPPRTEELLALGIISVTAERLRRGESANLPKLAPELATLAQRPFVEPTAR